MAKNSIRVSVRSRLFMAASAVLLFVIVLQLVAWAQGISGIYMQPVVIYLLYLRSGYATVELIPLLALTVAVPAISMERANGTLRFVLSQGATDAEYVLGRVLGSVITIYLPILVAFAVFAGLALGPYQALLSSMGVSRMVATLLNIVLVVAAYGALGSFISVVTKRPLVSLLLGMAAFFFLGDFYQMIGRLVGLVAVGLSPGASTLEFIAQYGNYTKAYNAAMSLSPSFAASSLQGNMNPLFWGKPIGLDFYSHYAADVVVLAGYLVLSLVFSLLLFRRMEK